MKLCIQTKRQSDKIMRKKIYKYLPFLFIAVLSGSTFGVEKHPEDRTIAYQSCPAKTFEDFAVLFSNNVDFQRAYTHFPLKKMEVDDSGEELKTIINLKNKEQISFPVIPNEAERENKGLELHVIDDPIKNHQIRLVKPDTDYQVDYFFFGSVHNSVSFQ